MKFFYSLPPPPSQQTKNRHSESEIAPTEVSTTSSESSFFGIENDMLAVSTLGITTSSQHSERKRGCPHFGPNSEGGECPHSEQEGSPHSEWEGSPHLEWGGCLHSEGGGCPHSDPSQPPPPQSASPPPPTPLPPPLSWKKLNVASLLCVQEVVNSIYIMSYYINWSNYLLDTG